LMILVTGATGNVGADLVSVLAEAGQETRALCRDPSRAAFPPGVEVVGGDLDDPPGLRPALRGITSMFLLPGYRDMPGLLGEAADAGVARVVLLSGQSAAKGDMLNAISRYMIISERAVHDSGLAWTVLRPAGFMSNTLQWTAQLRDGNTVRAPFADVRVAMIDPHDIAAVAAAVLTSDGHDGQCYTLSGPESLLPADRVAILARVLGRDLRFEAQPDDEARAEMEARMPSEYVDAFFDFYVGHSLDESAVLPTVEQVLGRPPRPFEQWVRAQAGAFR
jgi:uncharacterized protein YbjT (DUF2867 family)